MDFTRGIGFQPFWILDVNLARICRIGTTKTPFNGELFYWNQFQTFLFEIEALPALSIYVKGTLLLWDFRKIGIDCKLSRSDLASSTIRAQIANDLFFTTFNPVPPNNDPRLQTVTGED